MENNSYIENIAGITSESEDEKYIMPNVGSRLYSFEMDGERQGGAIYNDIINCVYLIYNNNGRNPEKRMDDLESWTNISI